MTRIDAFIERYGWQMLVALVAGVVTVTTAKAQLDNKAEKSTVEAMAGDIRDIKNMVCRMPENVHDSACQR